MSVSLKEILRRRTLGSMPNFSHPLMRKAVLVSLVNEGSGGTYNLAQAGSSKIIHTVWSSNWWGAGPIGVCPFFPLNIGTAAAFENNLDSDCGRFVTASNFSAYCYVTPPPFNVGSCYFERWGGPVWALKCATTNLSFMCSGSSLTGTSDITTQSTRWNPHKFVSYGCVNNASNSTRSIFLEGNVEATGASTSINDSAGGSLLLAGGYDTGRTNRGWHGAYLLWNRALSNDEMAWLANEPFDWVQAPLYRKYMSIAPSGALTFSFGDALVLVDGISLIGGAPDYNLAFSDSLQLQDGARLGVVIVKQLSDSINNFLDAVALTVGLPKQAFDTMQFNWADALVVKLLGQLPVTAADTLALADSVLIQKLNTILSIMASDSINTLADAVRLTNQIRLALGDNIVLSDSFRAKLHTFLHVTDNLNSFLDAVRTYVDFDRQRIGDSFTLTDSVSIDITGVHKVTVTDTLALTDSVSIQTIPAIVSRIRRYLNDIG